MPKTTEEVMILTGKHDEEVVDRFNELVNSDKISAVQWTPSPTGYNYRLRPTSRYRAFTAVEAAGHLGRRIKIHECDGCFYVDLDAIWVGSEKRFSFQYACDHGKFTDTGEPFGVSL